ncbi:MBL fold metallo-hydrolase [Myxococcus sp. MxC21-1]|uniref:MBL fold metallo-hydrolase n=1 Tax=Myxococcus sp. MxC21-1 TaxID=3041439 RepID=UPI00292E3042|nr:MBL fold metallo-hydrolase [Myxococcus sp. MxC21-1]WNZ60147.1 MBL fold metallo-hydrolase [Myxococcus sp. MxC21-1]
MEGRFHGVRGSIAVSGSRIGGNTACVEVTSQGHWLILDASTGLRALGEIMMREGAPQKATLFFSHLHWDHVQGFPFFTPAYLPTSELPLYCPGANGAQALQSELAAQMQPPHFAVPPRHHAFADGLPLPEVGRLFEGADVLCLDALSPGRVRGPQGHLQEGLGSLDA